MPESHFWLLLLAEVLLSDGHVVRYDHDTAR